MAILSTNGTFGATDTVTSTKLNNIADAATFDDPVDDSTLELHTDGKLRIKDDGVTPDKLSVGAPTWDSDGRIGIGTSQTSVFGGTTNKINVEYNTTAGYHIVFNDTRTDGGSGAGVAHFLRSGSPVGAITTTTTTTSYNTTSDYRLKEDIVDITDSIERLKALKPCNFAWKSDGTRVDGFIAHEAQEVVPEAVTGTKDAVDNEGNPDYQGIDQAKLVPLLTKALQEAVAKIESLETRVKALEGA